ncbi:Kelch repeat-containing protein [Mariniblastus fucicola]|uniref:N-acetylneuraminate epimerase n=1 Tax=Mariniblastus fucicola TaxID=980251 RepID=A0A5B9PEE8_9BACT|nr:kelch repeat-containing protein [Mariniblastus fucicola]QEG23879.1 N-acetylneuraminate epimerase [Mariniblastus fucicola]
MQHLQTFITYVAVTVLLTATQTYAQEISSWQILETVGQPTARHEAAMVSYKGKLFLIGGRRINPVDVYDPATNTWTEKSKTPIELHHFQAVVHGDAIYLIGAMTGGWPRETPLEKVVVYYPELDQFKFVHSIPESRRRGGAGAVVYKDKIYIVGGITNGHWDGSRPWLDVYDPVTGAWTPKADAPHARDHFSAVVIGDKLYAAAGRTTSQKTGQGFDLTVAHCDVYDLKKQEWLSNDSPEIPTQRAGNMAIAIDGDLVVGGGESVAHVKAHDEVEVYSPETKTWSRLPNLNRGRHGSAFAIIDNYLYTASGCGNRGGKPELTSLERLKLPAGHNNGSPTKKLHTKTLSFIGPQTAEDDDDNPFTNFRLNVIFKHAASDRTFEVRGFYAADGDAANTSATTGNVWQARFTPDRSGDWTYQATLRHGTDVAIDDEPNSGTEIELDNAAGRFTVTNTTSDDVDFRNQPGRIVAKDGYFVFEGSDKRWLKGGTDSPENLLAFVDFDGTFRMQASDRDGEASTDEKIHRYESHLVDWKQGDPTWGQSGAKGKAIIGAFNYLASEGVNSAYFLTLNINGDGKDVWPYLKPDDFERFDCSKLDQWEIVFEHMQSRGIMLHVQTQETENETMLDNGDTGRLRKLYYRELIARFAHHPALVWNLGEENGPAEWTPVGQTPEQRIAMADYIKASDPYKHPILMHTHADSHSKDELLTPLLSAKSIDGLSFQVDQPESVHSELQKWIARSTKVGHRWMITMDETGPWMHGAVPDSEGGEHDGLRRNVLWGSLMGGAAGVEWYFGAKHPHNDLTSEDWRQRKRIWELTRIARTFFETHLRWWEMKPSDDLLSSKDGYCLSKPGEVYVVYLPVAGENRSLDLGKETGQWSVAWFNPRKGGNLTPGTIAIQEASSSFELGLPPDSGFEPGDDCVALVRKK